MSTSRPVRAGVDAYVWGPTDGPKSKKSFSEVPRLRAAANTKVALIRMKSPAPRNANILSATLVLTQAANASGAHTIAVRATEKWTKNVTWNRRPNTGSLLTSLTKTGSNAGTKWQFDVTSYYQSVSAGAPQFGLELRNSNANDMVWYSLNGGRFQPYVEVTWTTRPEKPTVLKPSYGAISGAFPTLVGDFTDYSGSTELQSLQVQIDPSGNFTSPAWDSGERFVDTPQLPLAGTGYPGVPGDGNDVWWRIRFRDGDGEWSLWSDAVPMWRIPKGTLAIVSPGAAPNDFVSEFTPPIVWNFSLTQSHYRVKIARASDPKRIIVDSGKVQGDEEAWTVPKRVLKDGLRYIVTVQCWDTVDREGTPGEPIYVEASREFEVDFDGTIDPFAFIVVANPESTRPWVDLLVGRATAPDTVTILRDGVAIETDLTMDELEPDEIIGGVQSYRWRDWTARPGVEHTYEAKAEVNGKLALGGPTITITPKCVGIWLADPNTGEEVVVGGSDTVSTTQEDTAETWYTYGGLGSPVRAVDGVNGMSGEVTSAMLRSRDGFTWKQIEDTLLEFKGRATETYRLAWGDLNIPVVIGNVKQPTPHSQTRYDQILKEASWSWWQNGEHGFEVQV